MRETDGKDREKEEQGQEQGKRLGQVQILVAGLHAVLPVVKACPSLKTRYRGRGIVRIALHHGFSSEKSSRKSPGISPLIEAKVARGACQGGGPAQEKRLSGWFHGHLAGLIIHRLNRFSLSGV
jgi:hypothetical protein